MTVLGDLTATIERLWPLDTAEDWDSPGLVIGSLGSPVSRILLTVDVTHEVLDYAIEQDFDLILAHHPMLMRGVTSVAQETLKGSLVTKAIKANVAVYAAHTNADSAINGVSAVLAEAIGVLNAAPMTNPTGQLGLGRFGTLAEQTTLGQLALHIARILPATASGVRVAGDYNQVVESVSVCGGAGDSLLPTAIALGVDVYVTADLRHHVVQDVKEAWGFQNARPAVIDVSHWASEWLWLEQAAQDLRKLHSELDFQVCDIRTDPWDFVVTQ